MEDEDNKITVIALESKNEKAFYVVSEHCIQFAEKLRGLEVLEQIILLTIRNYVT